MAYRLPEELANPLVIWQTAADLMLMAVGARVLQARIWETPRSGEGDHGHPASAKLSTDFVEELSGRH
ncbi:MAG: hypothetical protein AAFR88_08940 [Pseudomonadota bacterium]